MFSKAQPTIRFEGYLIDRSAWQLQWQSETIALSRKTFDLLLYLIDHRDRVVTKDELMQAIWRDQFVEEGNLSQHIFLVRKALSRHASGQKIVETIPGRGYRFIAPLDVDRKLSQESSISSQVRLHSSSSFTQIMIEEDVTDAGFTPALTLAKGDHLNRLRWVLVGFLVVTVAIVAWFSWQRWLDRSAGAPVDVVVAPLAGSTGDTVLDTALVDALRMDLSQSPFVSPVAQARVRATLADMKKDPDAPMTSATAVEVCERTNSQAVLTGSIVRVGQHFLLTERATSCVSGSTLAEAKQEVVTAEGLPHGVDKLGEEIRRKLGESRRSIARFDVPIFPGQTPSLEALKSFSQAEELSNQGKYLDAISLLKQAVAADPDFAEAYYDLALFYKSTLDPVEEQKAILRAYDLRDSVNEPTRLGIVALYHSDVTLDLYEGERNLRNWTELYPQSVQAWNRLSIVERDLGHHQEALVAAQRALKLRPNIPGLYVNVAYEQRRLKDAKASIVTCESALARGLDSNSLRTELFNSAYVLHDAARVQQQRDWANSHPDAYSVRIAEVVMAITEGRFSDAHRLIPQTVELLRRHGQADLADDLVRETSLDLFETGDSIEGTRLFHSVSVDPTNEFSVKGLAVTGDFKSAEADLRTVQAKLPHATEWNDYRAPEVRAIMALAAHKPKDAISDLDRTRSIEGLNPFTTMLRADAYLAAGEPTLAENAYRWVIDGPFLSSDGEEFPLSWLGLGRALAAEGNRTAAADAYQHFFSLWSHADANAQFLRQAKQEFANL